MARVALEIPKVGLVMENARLVRWLKDVGDAVKQGEPVLGIHRRQLSDGPMRQRVAGRCT